jgi:hypothetical protein
MSEKNSVEQMAMRSAGPMGASWAACLETWKADSMVWLRAVGMVTTWVGWKGSRRAGLTDTLWAGCWVPH